MHCREHVVDVHGAKERVAALGARVFIIGFEPERRARGWLEQAEVSFPFLIDEGREVYEAYELERSIWRSYHPRNLWSYAKAFLRGEGLPEVRADPTQLGGDFVIGRDQRLHLAYYSRDATDRPAVSTLIGALADPAGD